MSRVWLLIIDHKPIAILSAKGKLWKAVQELGGEDVMILHRGKKRDTFKPATYATFLKELIDNDNNRVIMYTTADLERQREAEEEAEQKRRLLNFLEDRPAAPSIQVIGSIAIEEFEVNELRG